ncbi:MAG: LPS export ABC transporter permease LptG [Rhodobacteraceae bacterium]|nr:LPS export ABC transporter permease LptG [Paracoccaceae bacterium]
MILHFYFARRFLRSFLLVTAAFMAILIMIDLVDQARRFGSTDAGFNAILGLTLLRVPESFYQILPLVVILATLAMYLGLARTSELVVARAAGRSAIRSLGAPVAMALLIGVVGVAAINPIVAATQRQYERLANEYITGEARVLSVSREGLWLRQGDAMGQTVVRAVRSNLDGTELYGVTFVSFDQNGTSTQRIEADTARLVDGRWNIENAKIWTFAPGVNPEATAQELAQTHLDTTLTRDQILDSFGEPSTIPIWELPAFIGRLEDAGFSARIHRVWLQMELAMPVFLAAMVLAGASFTMRHTRFGRTGLMVLMALGLGFALYFVRNFAQVLGENGQIPVMLAAWGPPVAALLLPAGLLLHLEDG